MKNTPFSVITFLLLVSTAYGSRGSGIIKEIRIEFDGGKGAFYGKYDLWTSIKDSATIHQIESSIDTNKQVLFCPDIKPVMWEIDVFGVYEDDTKEYLITVGSNTEYVLSVRNNLGVCFSNSGLVKLLKEIVMVDQIEKYSGYMNQLMYDAIKQDQNYNAPALPAPSNPSLIHPMHVE